MRELSHTSDGSLFALKVLTDARAGLWERVSAKQSELLLHVVPAKKYVTVIWISLYGENI